MQQTRLKGPWPTAKHSARADLIASQVVPILLQQLGYLLYVDSVVEGGGVTDLPLVGGHLALQALNQVTDGHTRWNGVRVDDDVRGDALARERHVLDKPRSNQAWTPQALLAFRTSVNTMSATGTEKKGQKDRFLRGQLTDQTLHCHLQPRCVHSNNLLLWNPGAAYNNIYQFQILVLRADPMDNHHEHILCLAEALDCGQWQFQTSAFLILNTRYSTPSLSVRPC